MDRFYLGDNPRYIPKNPEACAENCQWCNEKPNTLCDRQNAKCQYFQFSFEYSSCYWLKITSADCPVDFIKNSDYNLYKMKKSKLNWMNVIFQGLNFNVMKKIFKVALYSFWFEFFRHCRRSKNKRETNEIHRRYRLITF